MESRVIKYWPAKLIKFSIVSLATVLSIFSIMPCYADIFSDFENNLHDACMKKNISEYIKEQASNPSYVADFQCKLMLNVCNGDALEEKCHDLLKQTDLYKESETKTRSLLSHSDYNKYKSCMLEGSPHYTKKIKIAATGIAELICKHTVEECINAPSSKACLGDLGKYNITTRIPNLSPIYLAAQEGDIHRTKQLIQKGVDLNYQRDSRKGSIPGKAGWTALMIATAEGNENIVELLLKVGADASITSEQGETALSLALDYKYQQIVDLLISYGAKN